MRKKIRLTLFTLLFVALFIHLSALLTAPIHAQLKIFTTEELAQFDGKDGHKAYFAYEGKVYDVTGSKLWKEGQHYGLQAGTDLTGKMAGAPHGTEVFQGLAVVGTYDQAKAVAGSPSPSPVATQTPAVQSPQPKWYEQRIRVMGMSLLGWTGILLGVFFVLNFATCFALPWSKLPLPWKGARPGPDALDQAEAHLKWSTLHKYFAWLTVVFGILHGVIGVMQLLGYRL